MQIHRRLQFSCRQSPTRVRFCFLADPKEITNPSEFLIMANQTAEQETAPVSAEGSKPKYPGILVTCNSNQLVTQWVKPITEGSVFYPITPSTEGGEIYQQAFAQGALDVWGNQKLAVETEVNTSCRVAPRPWP